MILEPASLPYGGAHHGVDGYVALMQHIIATFELEFEPHGLHALDAHKVLLHMDVTFTARGTGKRVRLPVLELLEVTNGSRTPKRSLHQRHRRPARDAQGLKR